MKKTVKHLLILSILLPIAACSPEINETNVLIDQGVSALSRANAYPFNTEKDFFPLYEASYWKYDVYDKSKNLITTVTKTISSKNEASITQDKVNNYFITAFQKTYSNTAIKDKEAFEFFRRRDNQIAFGKTDNLFYYPDKNSTESGFDPYLFRPYVSFDKGKTEKITVKAGTFDCIKSSFSIAPLDSYTIWYAKGIGEIKRIKDSSGFQTYTYELSEYSAFDKQFVVKDELIKLSEMPKEINAKVDQLKMEYLKLNELPSNLFELKSNGSTFVASYSIKHNQDKMYEIVFENKSLSSKDNVNLTLFVQFDSSISNVKVRGDKDSKPTHKGKVVDKLPLIKK